MDQPKRYESLKHVVGVSEFVLNVLVLIYLLTSGWSARIRSFAELLARSEWLTVMIYVIIVGAVLKLLDLPLSLYSGYILEHRFGLSRQSLAGWIKDQLKALAVGVPLAVAAIEVIYLLLRVDSDWWWIYASAAFIAFAVVMANLAPVLLLPLFFKFKPVDNPDLQNRVNRLARRTSTQVCGIFEWSLGEKTRKANAAVVGWGNTRRIIVSDTLLENFSGEEIEVIMAHELCHHVKNHIWYGMALQSVLTIVALYAAHRVMPPLSQLFGLNGIADVANFPLLALLMTTLSLLVLPVVNYLSRRLEREADLYALDVTGDALAFVSSMEKLAELNLSDKAPNKIIEFIFHSHPSVEDRIKLAADRVGQNV
ncbi:MAG TPA: M48 family metallopeptidase [Terriglobia bacterium]|nr:M48 family metallopeptidase [Terriglobia bacterium]